MKIQCFYNISDTKLIFNVSFVVLEGDEEQFTTDAVPFNEEYEEYGKIRYFIPKTFLSSYHY